MKSTRILVGGLVVIALASAVGHARRASSAPSVAQASDAPAGAQPGLRTRATGPADRAKHDEAGNARDDTDRGYGDATPLEGTVRGFGTEAWAAEEAAATEGAERGAGALRPIDPTELGYDTSAALEAAARRRLHIPADRPIEVKRGEREGRPVVSVLVAPKSQARGDE